MGGSGAILLKGQQIAFLIDTELEKACNLHVTLETFDPLIALFLTKQLLPALRNKPAAWSHLATTDLDSPEEQ